MDYKCGPPTTLHHPTPLPNGCVTVVEVQKISGPTKCIVYIFSLSNARIYTGDLGFFPATDDVDHSYDEDTSGMLKHLLPKPECWRNSKWKKGHHSQAF